MLERPHAGASPVPATRNAFDHMEWAGAFGDLGTLIPFVVAYIGMVGMDPFGILFALGLALIICGVYYRTPMPVQPMKAAGAVAVTQAAQTAVITSGAVIAAGLVTGAIWLVLGLTGAARRISATIPRFVVVGIVLGLGMAFMIDSAIRSAVSRAASMKAWPKPAWRASYHSEASCSSSTARWENSTRVNAATV